MNLTVWTIFNPVAGPFNVEAQVEVARCFWEERGWRVIVCPTGGPDHATALARQAVEVGVPLVLVAGGDGTVRQVAQGLAGSQTVLAILPLGTSNVLAQLLNVIGRSRVKPVDPALVCQGLAEGRVHTVDLGRVYAPGSLVEGPCFISWAGVGLDGHVIDRVEPRPKWVKRAAGLRWGWLPFVLVGVSSAFRFKGVQAQVTVDGAAVIGSFVLIVVANSRLYGGGLVELCKDSCLDDGLLDIWLFEGKQFRQAVTHLVRLLTARHLKNPGTMHVRGREVVIEGAEPMEVELDGEPAGWMPLRVVIEPRSLLILVPQNAPSNLFLHPGVPLAERLAGSVPMFLGNNDSC